MNSYNPLYVSAMGGSISCFLGDGGRVFRSCFLSRCVYSSDLHSAKYHLEHLEDLYNNESAACPKDPPQRKTTLKWNGDGSLSEIDMARILDRLSIQDLTECALTCHIDKG